VLPAPLQVLAWLLIVAAAWSVRDGHTGWGFAATTAAIAATLVSFFVALYPNVMISKTNSAYNLTVANSAAGHYALVTMTVVAVIFAPLVIAYQAWSYHVFRGRITGPPVEASTGAPKPVAAPSDGEGAGG
jgi:cytochrome d ubiquinol oxidase subunit II